MAAGVRKGRQERDGGLGWNPAAAIEPEYIVCAMREQTGLKGFYAQRNTCSQDYFYDTSSLLVSSKKKCTVLFPH